MAEQLDQLAADEKETFETALGLLVSPINFGGSTTSRFLRDSFKAMVVPALGSAFFETGAAGDRLSMIRSAISDSYLEDLDYRRLGFSLGFTEAEGQDIKERLQTTVNSLLQ
jgi:hypothetical protein